MDPTWVHPFTCVISGPTGCGKTHFVERFLTHLPDMMQQVPEEVIWCYGEWQEGYEALKSRDVKFIEGVPDVDTWSGRPRRRLVIIDDLMQEIDDRVTRLFTKGSHHRNISVILIVQNLFGKNKEQRTISLNSHYLVVFKNPRDQAQIIHLGKQMYPGQSQYVSEAFKSATEVPHGYLLFDLKQNTPDYLRLRSAIFPGEQHTVYVPRKK